MPLRDRRDPRRHRRREERRLSRGRRRRENRLEVLGEAHVEHLVGFVEHDDLNGVELERGAPQMVERAARRRDGDVTPRASARICWIHRRAAVERHDRERGPLRVFVHGLGDLHRQLARRNENQAARSAATRGRSARESIDQRQRERGRLAGARARLSDQIAPGQEMRNGFPLNGRRLFVAQRRDRLHKRVTEPQSIESDCRLDGRQRGHPVIYAFTGICAARSRFNLCDWRP